MNWIKGKPTTAGLYWVVEAVDVYLVRISASFMWDYENGIYCEVCDSAITHYMPIEKPEAPK